MSINILTKQSNSYTPELSSMNMDQKKYKLERERLNFQMGVVQNHLSQGNGNVHKPYTDSEKKILSERIAALERLKEELEYRMKRGY